MCQIDNHDDDCRCDDPCSGDYTQITDEYGDTGEDRAEREAEIRRERAGDDW